MRFLWPRPDLQFLTPPFPWSLHRTCVPTIPLGPGTPAHASSVPGSLTSVGAWWEEPWEACGAGTFSVMTKLCDRGACPPSLCFHSFACATRELSCGFVFPRGCSVAREPGEMDLMSLGNITDLGPSWKVTMSTNL